MKIAFCCKYLHSDRSLSAADLKRIEAGFNCKSLQVTSLIKLDTQSAHAKLDQAVIHNIQATKNLIDYVCSLPENQRMVRLGSDILPLYTHPISASYYASNKAWISVEIQKIGLTIRNNNIRIDMHPGPFTIFNTPDQKILDNSVAEIEAHTDLFRWLGLTGWHTNGSMINIHLGNSKYGSTGFIRNLPLLSTDAKNLLTVENDEFSCGLDECLEMAEHIPVCLDIHHHWVATGEYIQPDDPRVDRIVDSWRGVRPAIHYSQSSESEGLATNVLPDLRQLVASGKSRAKLRSHSDYYNNTACNAWARTFGDKFDIILESKAKNLASTRLASEWF